MTGADFLQLAARLVAGPTEAEWRTASSRAYYACFHAARDLLSTLGFRVPLTDQAHNYLYARLNNCGEASLQQAATDLYELRQIRNRADYSLNRVHTRLLAIGQVALARHLFQTLTTIDETIHSRITDVMKEYERTIHQVTWSPPA